MQERRGGRDGAWEMGGERGSNSLAENERGLSPVIRAVIRCRLDRVDAAV